MSTSESGGEIFTASHVIEYTYRRSLGPVMSRFLTGLRDRRIEGIRTRDGRVMVPPKEYDPETSASLSEMVELGDSGCVTTWAWVKQPRTKQPLDHAFAYALIKLDGADTPMLHAVDAGDESRMRTGMRVRARWKEERVGHITDIQCFEPEGA